MAFDAGIGLKIRQKPDLYAHFDDNPVDFRLFPQCVIAPTYSWANVNTKWSGSA